MLRYCWWMFVVTSSVALTGADLLRALSVLLSHTDAGEISSFVLFLRLKQECLLVVSASLVAYGCTALTLYRVMNSTQKTY